MGQRQPVAFLSYVRSDDEHENGRLTQFCERLSAEVKMQTGGFPRSSVNPNAKESPSFYKINDKLFSHFN